MFVSVGYRSCPDHNQPSVFMPFTPELIDELNILNRYDLSSTQKGLKVHGTAPAEVISATQRLYEKGLLSQVDGGYLTDLGRETAEQVQAALTVLTAH